MASSISFMSLAVLALALVVSVQSAIGGGIECENLNKDSCAFAVSSSGKRCVLEKQVRRSGEEAYTCRTSEIAADQLKDWVETDSCVEACGLERTALGISSDSLLEPQFTQKLCSPQCFHGCPNIIDLYFNLAAGEGVFLPKLCEARGKDERRGLVEVRSSGYVAPGPEAIHSERFTIAPGPEAIHSERFTIAPGPEAIHSERFTIAPAISPSYP